MVYHGWSRTLHARPPPTPNLCISPPFWPQPANVTRDMNQQRDIQTTLAQSLCFYTISKYNTRIEILRFKFGYFLTASFRIFFIQFATSSMLIYIYIFYFYFFLRFPIRVEGFRSTVFWFNTNSSILLESTPVRGLIYVRFSKRKFAHVILARISRCSGSDFSSFAFFTDFSEIPRLYSVMGPKKTSDKTGKTKKTQHWPSRELSKE